MHTRGRVPTVGDGILAAGMGKIPVGPRSATRKELVDQTRTDHVTGMSVRRCFFYIVHLLLTFPDNWVNAYRVY